MFRRKYDDETFTKKTKNPTFVREKEEIDEFNVLQKMIFTIITQMSLSLSCIDSIQLLQIYYYYYYYTVFSSKYTIVDLFPK